MDKEKFICEECSSEFIIEYSEYEIAETVSYCPFCGEPLEIEEDC